MSILSTGFSALGKLIMVVVLLAAFLAGMAGVVYMSLSGSVIQVPEIVGKDFVQSEKELAALGLKIRRRADRVSPEPINTVLEQLPKAGETVKSGQWITVIVSKAGAVGEETPSPIKNIEEDDTEKIEEMISDKPKKAKANSNTNKKKADTTRDVIANESSSNTSTDSKDTPPKETDTDKKDTSDKPKDTTPAKPQGSPAGKAPGDTKPKP